jgi:hypothetical protein
MSGDISQDCGERSDAEWGMEGDRQVMFAVLVSGQSEVTAALARDRIAEFAKKFDEIASREITGKPHTAMTSSRTWWRRTTFGARPSSK